jgi:hypothetical protein
MGKSLNAYLLLPQGLGLEDPFRLLIKDLIKNKLAIILVKLGSN